MSFLVVGGILSGYVEGGDGLSSVHTHTNARIIADTHTLVSNNWEVFIAKYVSNRAWTTGVFMEEDIKAIMAECCQRELKQFWRRSRGMKRKVLGHSDVN